MFVPYDSKSLLLLSKRVFDISVAAIALILLMPVMMLIGVAIRISMGAPVLFRQLRPGLHGKPFRILKFRTMSEALNPNGILEADVGRLTPLGRFLRSTSLDELPELCNVLYGDMSLVGPRPLLMQYLRLYSPDQMRRHDVRPGITGWAQVNGRNLIGWDEKFTLDVWYVDNWSLWLDLRILSTTVWKVILREGITQEDHASVEYFQGH